MAPTELPSIRTLYTDLAVLHGERVPKAEHVLVNPSQSGDQRRNEYDLNSGPADDQSQQTAQRNIDVTVKTVADHDKEKEFNTGSAITDGRYDAPAQLPENDSNHVADSDQNGGAGGRSITPRVEQKARRHHRITDVPKPRHDWKKTGGDALGTEPETDEQLNKMFNFDADTPVGDTSEFHESSDRHETNNAKSDLQTVIDNTPQAINADQDDSEPTDKESIKEKDQPLDSQPNLLLGEPDETETKESVQPKETDKQAESESGKPAKIEDAFVIEKVNESSPEKSEKEETADTNDDHHVKEAMLAENKVTPEPDPVPETRTETIKRLQTERDELTFAMKEATAVTEPLRQELERHRQAESEIQTQLLPLKNAEQNLDAKISSIEVQIKVAQSIERRHLLEDERWKQEDDRQSVERDRWQIEDRLNVIEERTTATKAQLDSQEDETRRIRNELQTKKDEITRLEKEEEIDTIEREMESIEHQWLDNEKEIAAFDGKLEKMHETLDAITNQKRKIEDDERLTHSRDERQKIEEERQQLETKRRVIETDRRQIENEKQVVEKKMNDLKPSYRILNSRLERLQTGAFDHIAEKKYEI